MGQIGTDKKLELIRSIRMNHQNNRVTMGRREQIVYGHSHPLVSRGELYGLESAAIDAVPGEGAATDIGQHPLRSFKIRLLIAVVLFGAFIVLDRSGQSFFGITAAQISEAITAGGEEAFTFLEGLFNF